MTETLRDIILETNTYFNKGFSDAYATSEGVYKDGIPLMPNDTLGDYFYLRTNNIAVQTGTVITDCAVPFRLSANVFLVAVMRGADEMVLINNLMSTLAFNNGTIRSVIIQKEAVIQQELGQMSSDQVAATLANLQRNTAIVSINFDLRIDMKLYQVNCLPNPCKVCG